MNLKPIAPTAAAAAIAFSSLALVAANASAKGVRVKVSGTCTAICDWKLKAKNDDGRLEVEFEVDSNRNLRVWAVTLKDNGTTVWSGNRTTQVQRPLLRREADREPGRRGHHHGSHKEREDRRDPHRDHGLQGLTPTIRPARSGWGRLGPWLS